MKSQPPSSSGPSALLSPDSKSPDLKSAKGSGVTSFPWLPLIVALVLTGGLIGGWSYYLLKQPSAGGDFTLNHGGQNWHFGSRAKSLNLLYVGYVKCPDVCPMSLSFASQAFQKLSVEEKSKAQLIFISVDVDHDTAQSVAEYAQQFDPSFVGLTGAREMIDQTIRSVGASYVVENAPGSYLGYSVAHTDRLFFLDSKGRVIDTIPNPRSSELIVEKMKEHL